MDQTWVVQIFPQMSTAILWTGSIQFVQMCVLTIAKVAPFYVLPCLTHPFSKPYWQFHMAK